MKATHSKVRDFIRAVTDHCLADPDLTGFGFRYAREDLELRVEIGDRWMEAIFFRHRIIHECPRETQRAIDYIDYGVEDGKKRLARLRDPDRLPG